MDLNEENCPICLNQIDKHSKILIALCDHCLCVNCFNDLLLNQFNKCPICFKEFFDFDVYLQDKIERKSLTQEEVERVYTNKKKYESFLNGEFDY